MWLLFLKISSARNFYFCEAIFVKWLHEFLKVEKVRTAKRVMEIQLVKYWEVKPVHKIGKHTGKRVTEHINTLYIGIRTEPLKTVKLFQTVTSINVWFLLISLPGPGHPVLSWAKCFFCGLPSLSIKVVYSYADFCLSFNISIKFRFQIKSHTKCTIGEQKGSFASINAYKSVTLTADLLCVSCSC